MVLSSLVPRYLWTGVLLSAVSASIVINPPKVVVKFGDPTSAVCTTNLTHKGMGWEAPLNAVDMTLNVKSITWNVDSLTEWDISPFCYIVKLDSNQIRENLEVIVYKVPDNISISLLNPSIPVVEGNKYELQCNVKNSAPVGRLVVRWYKGKTELKRQNFSEAVDTPKDKITKLAITASGTDNGADFRCEALLELGPEGPQPPPKVTSVPLRMNILYGPKFSKNVEMFQQTDDRITLNCTVAGNPPPSYSWDPPIEGEVMNTPVLMLSPQTVGNYTCMASNAHGSAQKHFTITPISTSHTVFWAILGSGLVLAVLLIAGYLVTKKMSSNSVI